MSEFFKELLVYFLGQDTIENIVTVGQMLWTMASHSFYLSLVAVVYFELRLRQQRRQLNILISSLADCWTELKKELQEKV